MRLGLVPILEVEAEVIYEGSGTLPLSGQMFYVLEKSASDIIPLIEADHEKAMGELKSRAIKFIITDSQGKALVKNLEAKTYYVCGYQPDASGSWGLECACRYAVRQKQPGAGQQQYDPKVISYGSASERDCLLMGRLNCWGSVRQGRAPSL